ncbi:MAG: hypothetical protein ACRDSP_08780 [Pseudonocardiaceae bacterium]
MTDQPTTAILCILEIVSLDMQCTPAQMRAQLEATELPIRVIGELNGYPGILIEAEDFTAVKLREQLFIANGALEVVELRRHFHPSRLSTERLMVLIGECCRDRRLAIGASAAERAAQRRHLELLILASDLTKPYARMIQAVIAGTSYRGPLILTGMTREDLGRAAGVHRAACIGILRGVRHVVL